MADIDRGGYAAGDAPRRPAPTKATGASDPWEQVRLKLHDAAMQHSKEELRKRWEELEWEYKSMDPATRLKHCVMPSLSSTAGRTSFAALQEQYGVWNKISSAVSRESLYDLKDSLENSTKIDISDTSRMILLTYCDALTRHHQVFRFSIDEVVTALEKEAYAQALDMVCEIALVQGANTGLLLTWLTRLCADWNAGCPPANPPVQDASGMPSSKYNDFEDETNGRSSNKPAQSEENPGSLVAVLQSKASRHARLELNKSWDELDSAYGPSFDGSAKGGIGPAYAPFTRQEELFYVRNKIVYAIHEQSLVELRRALTYALAFGLDPKSLEIEAAYRDALAKHQQADGFAPGQVKDHLERGDWWSTLDVIIAAALSKGASKMMLLRVIGTFQSRVSLKPDAGQGRSVHVTETAV